MKACQSFDVFLRSGALFVVRSSTWTTWLSWLPARGSARLPPSSTSPSSYWRVMSRKELFERQCARFPTAFGRALPKAMGERSALPRAPKRRRAMPAWGLLGPIGEFAKEAVMRCVMMKFETFTKLYKQISAHHRKMSWPG